MTPCKCGCGAPSPTANSGGFASRACYELWLVRQPAPLDDAEITRLRLEGKSLDAISKVVGRSEGTISRRLRALGVTLPKLPVSPEHARRLHQKAEGTAPPPRIKRSSMPWARIGTYRHPQLGAWAFGCQVCSRHILGPMVEGMPAWKGQRL